METLALSPSLSGCLLSVPLLCLLPTSCTTLLPIRPGRLKKQRGAERKTKGSQGISLLPTPSPLFLGFSSSILCVFENFAVFKVASLGLGLVLSLFLSARKVQGSFYVFKLQILNFLMIKISLVT